MELLDNFLSEIELEGKSQNTIDGYRNRITRFLDFIGWKEIRYISRQDIIGFLSSLKTQNISNATLGAYITALRAWGNWLEVALWNENWRNVFKTFKTPKIPQHIPSGIVLRLACWVNSPVIRMRVTIIVNRHVVNLIVIL